MSRQGSHGEWKFGERCQAPDAQVLAVVNRTSDDQHGWDHIVEIEPPPQSNLPADLVNHLVQCFVQIKTTRTDKLSVRLKLSNAVKSAKSPNPCFVFLLHYLDGSNEPIFYGWHIWEREVSSWLRRAREMELKGIQKLRDQSVSLLFDPSQKLTSNPVDWMFSQFNEYGADAYYSNKMKIVNSTGYGEFSHEGELTVGPLLSHGDVVLNELGVVEDLPVMAFRLHDVRFGIKSIYPVRELTDGRVSFSKPGEEVTLRLSSHDGRSLEVPALAWVPRTVSMESTDFKMRVKAGAIDLIANPYGGLQHLDLKVDYYAYHPFLAQLGLLCLVNWSSAGQVRFEVSADIGTLLGGSISWGCKSEDWMKISEIVGTQLASILGVERCGDLSISLVQLSEISKSMYIVAAAFSSECFSIEAELQTTADSFETLMGYYYGEIGDWSFGVIYSAACEMLSSNGGTLKIILKAPKILHKMCFMQRLDKTIESIKREFINRRSMQKESIGTFEGGDLSKWAKTIELGEGFELSVKKAN